MTDMAYSRNEVRDLALDVDEPDVLVVPLSLSVMRQMSRKRTSWAFCWMKVRRASTSSPMRVVKTSSASGLVVEAHPEQQPGRRVHGGLPQLVGVHLAEALVALDGRLLAVEPDLDLLQLVVGVGVHRLLARLHLIERRLGDVDVARLDEVAHVTEEEGEQQGADVGAVDVGVGEDDHLVVAGLVDVEVVADAGADGGDQRLDLVVLQHPGEPCLLDVDDLAPDGENRLELAVAGLLGRATGRVALDDEQFALRRVARRAVGQLARQPGGLEQALAAGEVAGRPSRHAGP